MSQITSKTLKKVRKTNKGKTNKRKTNKGRTNKRKTNKRKTNNKISRTKRGGNDSSSEDDDGVNKNNSTIKIRYTTEQNPMHPQKYTIGECPICLEEMEEGKFATTKCNHTFHPLCLMTLCSLCSKKTNSGCPCPICRTDITEECKKFQEALTKAFETQKTVYTKGKLGG